MSGTNTPSGRIIAAANQEHETKDELGRKIMYRRLGALDRARLFKAVGPNQSQNVPYLGMALLAASVTYVDGVPTPFPSSDSVIEAAIARLGDEGLEAVAAALVAEQIEKGLSDGTDGTAAPADAGSVAKAAA